MPKRSGGGREAPPSTHAAELLITSPFGDPMSPQTWSGTTRNIAIALEAGGCQLRAQGAMIAGWKKRLAKLHHRLAGLGRHYVRGPLYSHFCAREVIAHARRLGIPCILHTSSFTVAPRGLAGPLRQLLFADSTWNLGGHAAGAQSNPRLDAVAEHIERRVYASVEHVFCTADYVRDNLIEHYGLRPEAVTAVGTGRSSVVQPYFGEKNFGARKVLFVAKQRFENKGGRLLLDAVRLLRSSGVPLHLSVVGQEECRSAASGVPGVSAYGFVTVEKLQSLYNEASLFAMPALYEPWGLVYLDALATRTPVLGLKRFALPEFTRNGEFGFLVEKADAAGVASALRLALESPETLRTMGERGQKYVLENYTWDNVAASLMRILRRDSKT